MNKQRNGGGKGQSSGGQDKPDLRSRAEAARALHCNVEGLAVVSERDPFNPQNMISGFMCKDEGEYFGSMNIVSVNGTALARSLVIYGMPTVNDVHKGNSANRNEGGGWGNRGNGGRNGATTSNASSAPAASSSATAGDNSGTSGGAPPNRGPWAQLDASSRVYIANKWNGQNLTVYKYHNEKGHQCVSIMPRGQAVMKGDQLQTVCELLKIPVDRNLCSTLQGGSTQALLQVFPLLEQPEVQSVTYELVGRRVPQLVRYDFDLKLQPLFATTYEGTLIPQALLSAKVIPAREGENPVQMLTTSDDAVLTGEFGPYDFDGTLLADFARVYRARALELNQQFRTREGLKDGYRTEHFVLEGKVVYLLNDFNGTVSRSSLYKLKPIDTAKSHVEMIDTGLQTQMFEALEKLYSQGISLSSEALRKEMEITERLWTRFGPELVSLAQARPNFAEASLKSTPKVLIVMGLPGSGKSTVANKLAQVGWTRVNQDEMGNRKKVEASAKTALQKGQNVIIDRCNFDFEQRTHFLELALKAGIRDVRCLWLDTPADVCKQRVSVRKDHPTIPEGDAGVAIIDRFGSLLVPPMPGEGFCQIVRAITEEDADRALETFAKVLLQ